MPGWAGAEASAAGAFTVVAFAAEWWAVAFAAPLCAVEWWVEVSAAPLSAVEWWVEVSAVPLSAVGSLDHAALRSDQDLHHASIGLRSLVSIGSIIAASPSRPCRSWVGERRTDT